MTLAVACWRLVIVAISDAEMPTLGWAAAAPVRTVTCVPAQTTRISRTKAPASARASLDIFSEPLLAGSNQDWAGAPAPAQPLNRSTSALPNPDALFRG